MAHTGAAAAHDSMPMLRSVADVFNPFVDQTVCARPRFSRGRGRGPRRIAGSNPAVVDTDA